MYVTYLTYVQEGGSRVVVNNPRARTPNHGLLTRNMFSHQADPAQRHLDSCHRQRRKSWGRYPPFHATCACWGFDRRWRIVGKSLCAVCWVVCFSPCRFLSTLYVASLPIYLWQLRATRSTYLLALGAQLRLLYCCCVCGVLVFGFFWKISSRKIATS